MDNSAQNLICTKQYKFCFVLNFVNFINQFVLGNTARKKNARWIKEDGLTSESPFEWNPILLCGSYWLWHPIGSE
jgi:hypothetical protein